METNPISYLQEHMQKNAKVIPRYVVIEEKTGTHVNWFKMRVYCNETFAEGEGPNKKEAKVNAAINLIKLLGICSANQIPSKTTSISSETSSSPSMISNYVGKLQEIAQQKGLMLPIYIDKAAIGPSHAPKFITVCKFMGYEEEGSASTKREAKTIAAKKMFQRVDNSDPNASSSDIKIKSYLETVNTGMSQLKMYEENQNAMARSAEKALKLYPPLSKNYTAKKLNLQDKRTYNDYHTFLRDSVPDQKRESIMDKLQDTIRACESYNDFNNINQPMLLLQKALEDLNIQVQELDVHKSKNKMVIFGLQLNTEPVITEIGCATTKSKATIQCILQMAVTISILIS